MIYVYLFISVVGAIRDKESCEGCVDCGMKLSPCGSLGVQRASCRHCGSAELSVAFSKAANGIMIVPDTKQKVFYF